MPLGTNGAPITSTDASTGNSFVVVDEGSGITLQMQSSIQTNYQIFNDELFQVTTGGEFGTFVPREWTLKQMTYSDSSLNSLFAYANSINTTKWVLFSVFLGVGLILLGVGVVVFLKFKKASAAASEPTRED